MGTRHSVWLFIPTENIRLALQKIETMTHMKYARQVDITLPDGEKFQITDTFPMRFSSNNVKYDDYYSSVSFQKILYIPIDDIIQSYMDSLDEILKDKGIRAEESVEMINSRPHYPLGYWWVSLSSGQKYCRIDIGAVVSSQNNIVMHSNAFHKTMLEILNIAGGIASIIFVGDFECFLLENPKITIILEDDDGTVKLDELVNDIVDKTRKAKEKYQSNID